MNWRGLEIYIASDCEPDEDALAVIECWDDGEVVESLSLLEPDGIHFEPVRIENGDSRDSDMSVVDAVLLTAWVERRLSRDEWQELHREREECLQDAADDAGEALMADRRAGVA